MTKEIFEKYIWKTVVSARRWYLNEVKKGDQLIQISEDWDLEVSWWTPGKYDTTVIRVYHNGVMESVYTAEIGNPKKSLEKVCSKISGYIYKNLTCGNISWIYLNKSDFCKKNNIKLYA